MMGTEIVPETSVVSYQLTRLTAREDFIKLTALKISDLASTLYNMSYCKLVKLTKKK
jgi:hypothetical protein